MYCLNSLGLGVTIATPILARMSFRKVPPPGIGTIVLMTLTGLGMLIALIVFVRRMSGWMPASRPLLPCYERLGRMAPGDPCTCGQSDEAEVRSYASCCRAKDVVELESAIHAYLMQRWSHKSFAGRRWSRPMGQRLKDYPIPEQVILPRWVRKPEDFEFPISEKLLRKWRPQQQNAPRVVESEAADDVPL